MSKNLVIVESPAKAKTIGKFLGRNYTVKASMGHVRDLPKSQLGVDVENGFTPKYITVRGQGKILQELRKLVKKAQKVYLATDPDREGEAISWHLINALKLDESEALRIEFNEITKRAVQEAIQDPRTLDPDRIDAQQARRILDRLVGYKLSPLLWSKVKPGLSAGRVQSVALRLICDREKEIDAFVPEEYWSLTADLSTAHKQSAPRFQAKLRRLHDEKASLVNEEDAKRVIEQVQDATFRVEKVTRRQRRRNPAPPFTTSTLQQEASRRLSFTARKTMSLAQQLYEGLEVPGEGTVGLITYLRTDATRVSEQAQSEARDFIGRTYGKEYVPKTPPRYKSRSGAQDAHEAIRPTAVERHPDELKTSLSRDQHRLYRLIWERFVASQMAPAIMDTLSVDISADAAEFRATGSTVKFPGFMSVYLEQDDDETKQQPQEIQLPPLNEGETLSCEQLEAKQHFTQPPPRYSEAALVKSLEELGIGRPSTYVQIMETIQRRRGYVLLVERRFQPTELGVLVVDLLKEHFPNIVDVEFTANLEERLDHIEEGEIEWRKVIEEFYEPFEQALYVAQEEIDKVEIEDEVTDEVCDQCGRNMVVKWGRFGKFLACPGYPECKHTRPLLTEIGVDCPECSQSIVERRSRRGRIFYGCSGYPDCDFTAWNRPINRRCPRCEGLLSEVVRKTKGTQHVCLDRDCGFSETAPEETSVQSDRGARNGEKNETPREKAKVIRVTISN